MILVISSSLNLNQVVIQNGNQAEIRTWAQLVTRLALFLAKIWDCSVSSTGKEKLSKEVKIFLFEFFMNSKIQKRKKLNKLQVIWKTW